MTTAIVIDDDVDIVDVFCEYLDLKGIRVLGRGHNGKSAVELYERLKPDLVFMDLMMPKYDGFYGLENIRKIDPRSKIIIITADLRADTIVRLNDLKPNHIFTKPCDLEKITKTLEKI